MVTVVPDRLFNIRNGHYRRVPGGGVAPPPVPPPATNPSGFTMPKGDLTGWKLRYAEDFNSDFAEGAFPGPYGKSHLLTYTDGTKDTSKKGQFSSKVVSAHDSMLDIHYQYLNGIPTGAALGYNVEGVGGWAASGQLYGRFSICCRAVLSSGFPTTKYGFVGLLWSARNRWADGEIDAPELPSGIHGPAQCFLHNAVGTPSKNVVTKNSGIPFAGGWHVYTLEWLADSITWYVDGLQMVRTTNTTCIPQVPFRWTFQGGTNGGIPDPADEPHVLIDWIAEWTAV